MTNTTASATASFEVGKTYYTRSVCDYDCLVVVEVAARTAQTIVTGEGKRLRIRLYRGVETVSPNGSYSMAPVVSADEPLPDSIEHRLTRKY